MTEHTEEKKEPDSRLSANAANRLRELCLEHARDLLVSAECVLRDRGLSNIAYHLAVLALEEIGKAGMVISRAVVGNARDTDWMNRRLEDHVWKIQWAIWSRGFSGNRIDPKDFEEARRFAQDTHARRLAGLYVDVGVDSAIAPRVAISRDRAVSTIELVRARLDIENDGNFDLAGPNERLDWFLDTIGSEQGLQRIFSGPFVAKYEEFKGDVPLWIAWAQKEFEKIADEEKAHLQRELARLPSAPVNAKSKWVIKIRLYTPSHSIRPKVLNYWNARVGWVKLSSAGSKKELLLEMTLGDSFSMTEIYDVGLSASKLCIAALNVGSLGFFWYDLPRQTTRYYENIRDIDTPKMDVDVSRTAGLLGDWKQGALSEKNLHHAIEFIAAFGSMADEEASPIFGPYLQGLVLLSKSDVHLSCDNQARDSFVQSLRAGCRNFRDWDGNDGAFLPSLHKVFEKIIPELSHRNKLLETLSLPNLNSENAFADALAAKRLTDLYLVLVADRIVSEQAKQKLPPD